MIINDKPITGDDKELLEDLPFGQQEAVLAWMRKYTQPAKTANKYRTSYGLKHIMSKMTGVYVTNNQFKDAMIIEGFYPVDETELNWRYRISESVIRRAEMDEYYVQCRNCQKPNCKGCRRILLTGRPRRLDWGGLNQ